MKIPVLVLLGMLLYACIPLQVKTDNPVPVYCKVFPSGTSGLDKKQVLEMIKDLSLPGKSFDNAMDHLRMANLLVHYNNPEPDYARALIEVNSYLSMAKDNVCLDHARSLKQVVKKVTVLEQKNKELSSSVKNGRKIISSSEKDYKKMVQELNRCKETIEKLQSLDLRIEKKRRNLR